MKDNHNFYGISNTFQLENKPLKSMINLNYNQNSYESTNIYYHGDGAGVSYLYHGGYLNSGIIIQSNYGDGKGKGYE